MKTADVFWFRYQLFVAMQSIYHPVLRTKVQSFTGRTAYEKWFIGMQTDSARYSWKPYPNLAVSRLGSEVCENARFQRGLHFWRPNWWMSLGFENYNREKQLTCWAMHEDNRCFWNYGAFVNCQLPLFCCKGIGRRRRDELKPTEIYTSAFQRVSRVQGVVVEDNPTKAADSHQKSVKIQDSKGFCISEGRIGGWVQGSIITTKKSNWLVGQCMKTADVSLSALCGYAKHLPSCTAYKGSVISWQNCSWEVIPWHADW